MKEAFLAGKMISKASMTAMLEKAGSYSELGSQLGVTGVRVSQVAKALSIPRPSTALVDKETYIRKKVSRSSNWNMLADKLEVTPSYAQQLCRRFDIQTSHFEDQRKKTVPTIAGVKMTKTKVQGLISEYRSFAAAGASLGVSGERFKYVADMYNVKSKRQREKICSSVISKEARKSNSFEEMAKNLECSPEYLYRACRKNKIDTSHFSEKMPESFHRNCLS